MGPGRGARGRGGAGYARAGVLMMAIVVVALCAVAPADARPREGGVRGLPRGPAGSGRARVAIVASEFSGVVPNGGVGTFYSALARALAGAGHDVTMLFTQGPRSHSPGQSFDHWVAHYAAQGVVLEGLTLGQRNPSVGHHAATSQAVYEWLRAKERSGRPFDVVHFPDWQGHGCFALLAKQQGIDFQHTQMAVMTHGPLRWARRSSGQALETQDDLEVDFLEQESIRAAGILVSPSSYLLEWIAEEGWHLPKNRRVFPYIMPAEARDVIASVARGETGASQVVGGASVGRYSPIPPQEVVFFGRLEVRKGAVLFCDAVDQLVLRGQLPAGTKFSFLGSTRSLIGKIHSGDYVARRMAAWGGHAGSMITNKDTEGALQFLLAGKRLAVLPSLVENSPLSIFELTGTGIPFIASSAGGIPDIVKPVHHNETLFKAGSVEALVQRISLALEAGVRPASAAYDSDSIEKGWVDWHASHANVSKAGLHADDTATLETGRAVRAEGSLRNGNPSETGTLPIAIEFSALEEAGNVSVCVALQTRGGVHGTLESVFTHLSSVREIRLVTNHETYEMVSELLHERYTAFVSDDVLAPTEYYSTWYTNSVPTMWNKCLESVRGGHVLFMHSGVYVLPGGLDALQTVAGTTGADIVTSHLKFYRKALPEKNVGAHLASLTGTLQATHTFLGGAIPLGAVKNVMTGPLLFVKRELLARLEGFREYAEKDYEAFEFAARSVISGAKMEVVPRNLYWAPRMEGLQRVYLVPPKMGPVFEAYFNRTGPEHRKGISEFSDEGVSALLAIERGTRGGTAGTRSP